MKANVTVQTMPVWDITGRSEDAQIGQIGEHATREVVAFVVETDEKADRYIAKLARRFPRVQVIDRVRSQVPCACGQHDGNTIVRIGPR